MEQTNEVEEKEKGIFKNTNLVAMNYNMTAGITSKDNLNINFEDFETLSYEDFTNKFLINLNDKVYQDNMGRRYGKDLLENSIRAVLQFYMSEKNGMKYTTYLTFYIHKSEKIFPLLIEVSKLYNNDKIFLVIAPRVDGE
jgi:hypothetical protein